MRRRVALFSLALLPAWAGLGHAAQAPYRNPGLLGPSGKATSLAAQAGGQRLVVVTMKGHWCPVCLSQLVRLAAAKERLERLRARVVGLNVDSPKANAEAAKAMEIPFAILSDPRHEVLEGLGLWRPGAEVPMPAVVVFDECGKQRARLVGRRPGERIEKRLFSILDEIAASPPECRSQGNA